MKRQRRLTSNLGWSCALVLGATVGLSAAPSLASASIGGDLTAGGGGVARVGGSAARGGGAIWLAAKKKKKKRKASSSGSAGAASTTTTDDSSDSGSDDSSAAAPSGGGASDQDVQKAARVTPTDDSGSSGGGSDGGDRPASRSKRTAATVEEHGSAAPAAEGPPQRFLDVAVGGSGFARGLTYNQLVQGNLREYQPRLLAGATAGILYYPGAQFSSGFVTNLGLDVNVAQAFGITSRTPDGVNFATQIHDYNGGVRLRIPVDTIEPSVTLGFGDSAYTFTGGDRTTLLLPDVHYQYVRAVVGIHVALPSNLSFFASGGYRHVLSAGQIKDAYFKSLTVRGAEADAYVAYAITNMIEARLGVDYRRYFYAMHSKNGDAYIAGGAVDQTYAGSLTLAVLLGGSGQPRSSSGGSSSSSSDEAPAAAPAESGSGDAEVKAKPKKKRKANPDSME